MSETPKWTEWSEQGRWMRNVGSDNVSYWIREVTAPTIRDTIELIDVADYLNALEARAARAEALREAVIATRALAIQHNHRTENEWTSDRLQDVIDRLTAALDQRTEEV